MKNTLYSLSDFAFPSGYVDLMDGKYILQEIYAEGPAVLPFLKK